MAAQESKAHPAQESYSSSTTDAGETFQSDSDIFRALLAREAQGHDLTAEEKAELKALRPRVMAERIAEAVYSMMGRDLDVEQALGGVRDGLIQANSDDPDMRTQGLAFTLQSLLDAPRATLRAIQLLHNDLTGGAPPPPRRTNHELRLGELEDWADGLLVAATETKADRELLAAAATLWLASADLIQNREPTIRRMGYIMGLDAIIAANFADRVFTGIRAALVDTDPTLELLGCRALEIELDAPPLAVYHSLDTIDVDVKPDGTMEIGRTNGRGVVTFDPRETYGLWMFMQLPTERALINQAEAKAQTATELRNAARRREEEDAGRE